MIMRGRCTSNVSTWHETIDRLPLDSIAAFPNDAQAEASVVATEQRETRVPEAVG
jgi:hypothetical protein